MRSALKTPGLILLFGVAALAADNNKYDLSQAQIDDIVQKFAAKEAQFAKAREVYTYRQTARIQELDDSGAITGRWKPSPTSYSAPKASARNTWSARRCPRCTTLR